MVTISTNDPHTGTTYHYRSHHRRPAGIYDLLDLRGRRKMKHTRNQEIFFNIFGWSIGVALWVLYRLTIGPLFMP